jgi:hypothetical protein
MIPQPQIWIFSELKKSLKAAGDGINAVSTINKPALFTAAG